MQNALYKVAGYLRLSREDGDKEESDSISSQRSIVTRKIEELGESFKLIDFYPSSREKSTWHQEDPARGNHRGRFYHYRIYSLQTNRFRIRPSHCNI